MGLVPRVRPQKLRSRVTTNICLCSKAVGAEHRPKKLYSYVKNERCGSTGIFPLRDGGIRHSSPKEKADILKNQIASLYTTEDKNHVPELGKSPYTSTADITDTENGMQKLLEVKSQQSQWTRPNIISVPEVHVNTNNSSTVHHLSGLNKSR